MEGFEERCFLTLTIDPKKWGNVGNRRLFIATVGDIVDVMDAYCKDDWEVVPELQRKGSLHYHLIYRPADMECDTELTEWVAQWRKEHGFICLKMIKDQVNLLKMRQYLRKSKLLYKWIKKDEWIDQHEQGVLTNDNWHLYKPLFKMIELDRRRKNMMSFEVIRAKKTANILLMMDLSN